VSKLYVANTTRQAHQFLYQVPEYPAPFMQNIPPGGQIAVSKDLNPVQLEAVVQHHRMYGMVHADERPNGYSGLCYSVDKPVKLDRIQNAVVHNDAVLAERGRKQREDAAIAVNSQIETQMREQDMPGNLRVLEMEAVEEVSGADTPRVAEGVRVSRESPAPRARGRRKA